MKIFEYDICDGNKGIIIAKDIKSAIAIFRKNYNANEYPIMGLDVENLDSYVCDINEISSNSDIEDLYEIV